MRSRNKPRRTENVQKGVFRDLAAASLEALDMERQHRRQPGDAHLLQRPLPRPAPARGFQGFLVKLNCKPKLDCRLCPKAPEAPGLHL